ncbi:L-aminopeptidase/D-esterase-like protein [Orenia metallireducens]|uniref:L-aminopeptidase/D-esterase n=1 Tax=Orenia metallireducens TaxID=1413210 RepID=A0A285G0Q4_9FIRM|nr:P1 family peptidase [Orenia metallireducens]PRX31758.1 L-aminopeptidase/D-esterase-like protein [Orenia metallireducens]SNY17095.1 L-aminopeptidase/D-esterase [Orenia metallireducens]
MKDYITDVPGIKVGHQDNKKGMTGCTVILADEGAVAGVDVRGSAPGTRETDLLSPINMIEKVNAVLLSGGSAFGLAAADGVMAALEEEDRGFDVGVTKVPIVPAAVLFDLTVGDHTIRPDYQMGYEAAKLASNKESRLGKVGVGMGCTVGKLLGPKQATPSGLGSASIRLKDEIYIGALVAVNAFGDIFDQEGRVIAGCKGEDGRFINTYEAMKEHQVKGFGQNTTIGVIATNAKLSKTEATKIAQVAHNGYAKHINPVHTMLDGDTIFAMSTGHKSIDINLLATAASEVMGRAIIKAIQAVKLD